MPAFPDYLTATDFYRLFQCPHWAYFERFASPQERRVKRQFTAREELRLENGVLDEIAIARRFLSETVIEIPRTGDPEVDFQATLKEMEKGTPFLFHGTLTVGDWTAEPDILERREGESKLGSWYYAPLDIKSTHALERYQKFQLTFYSRLLEMVQGRFPSEAGTLSPDGQRFPFIPGELIREFEEILVELERIRAGEKPEPVLRKSCFDTGPWGVACQAYAESVSDIALLSNLDLKKLRLLREFGVRTLDDAAEMDPAALDGVAPGLRYHGLDIAKRQAQSLKYGWVVVREPVVLPTEGLEIHFDIESDPPRDLDYLYGILIREPSGDVYRPFVAERIEDEEKMWREFLAWMETLPSNYVVYHYSPYERSRLDVLERRYGGSAWLNLFRERMVDLKEVTTSSVIYPLYFYGLKYICAFLGYSWKGDVKGGGQSIDVFEEYLASGDRQVLDSILVYNEGDVRATAHLKDWLVRYAKSLTVYEKAYPWESGTTKGMS